MGEGEALPACSSARTKGVQELGENCRLQALRDGGPSQSSELLRERVKHGSELLPGAREAFTCVLGLGVELTLHCQLFTVQAVCG